MMTLGGGNLRSASSGLQLLFGMKSAKQHKNIKTPSYIALSILSLCWLLFLRHAISAVDFAVHLTTDPYQVVEKLRINDYDTAQMLYGRPFNTTQCSEWRKTSQRFMPLAQNSCGLIK